VFTVYADNVLSFVNHVQWDVRVLRRYVSGSACTDYLRCTCQAGV